MGEATRDRTLDQRRRAWIAIAALVGALVVAVPRAPAVAEAAVPGGWLAMTSMAIGRAEAPTIVLDAPACATTQPPGWCGDVLVVAGAGVGKTAERFDLGTARTGPGTWVSAGVTEHARGIGATISAFPDGRVLLLGGGGGGGDARESAVSAELFDPATNAWRLTRPPPPFDGEPPFTIPSFYGHSATTLDGPRCRGGAPPAYCGAVLVVGGGDATRARPLLFRAGATADDDTWTELQPTLRRNFHTATLLDGPACAVAAPPPWCGDVLVVGGDDNSTSSVYDPDTATWTDHPLARRVNGEGRDNRPTHGAVQLATGEVLVVGGCCSTTSPATDPRAAQVFDPGWSPATGGPGPWREVARTEASRSGASSSVALERLPDGRVLATGGAAPAGSTAEVYDPIVNAWMTVAAPLTALDLHRTVRLRDGRVLALGGASRVSTVQLFDPAGAGPSVSSVTPASGVVDGGELVTIRGGGFDGAHTVRFGDVEVAPVVDSSQQLRVVTPAHDAGAVVVTVTSSVGTSAAGPASTFTFVEAPGRWLDAGGFTVDPSGEVATATRLTDGRTVATISHGTSTPASWSIYDPATQAWGPVGRLRGAHAGHTATPLADGRVLVVGGGTSAAEILDPVSGSWTATAPMSRARSDHAATRLASGQVLVTGGELGADDADDTAELFDPATGAWTRATALPEGLYGHTSTRLDGPECRAVERPAWCGDVLVTGTTYRAPPLAEGPLRSPTPHAVAARYDPESGTWTTLDAPSARRLEHDAIVLDGTRCPAIGAPDWCGDVLLLGGTSASNPVERFDPATDSWRPGAAFPTTRSVPGVVGMADGSVLVAGGRGADGQATATAIVYDPAGSIPGTWTPTAPLRSPRVAPLLARLVGTDVLALGGRGGGTDPSSERYVRFPVPPVAVITDLAPVTGSTIDPTLVTLRGEGLSGVDDVRIAGRPADLLLVSATEVVASVPPLGEGIADIVVRAAGSTVPATVPLRFTYRGGLVASAAGATGRALHTATRLSAGPDAGDVLVVGGTTEWISGTGNPPNTGIVGASQRYDPATGTWAPAPAPRTPRFEHTATGLTDGRVLIAGGQDVAGQATSTAESFDPTTNAWTDRAPLSAPRMSHTATQLPDGRVVVIGGTPGELQRPTSLATVEIYDPAANVWRVAAPMNVGRQLHTATALPDGRILVTGGLGSIGAGTGRPGSSPLASAEIFTPPPPGTGQGSWASAGPGLPAPLYGHAATLLGGPRCARQPAPGWCGDVLIAGGAGGGSIASIGSVLYDVGAQEFRATGSMLQPRVGHTASVLPDGRVFVAGSGPQFVGLTVTGPTATTEVFDPDMGSAGTWLRTAPLASARGGHSATPLVDGRVLIVGGYDRVEGASLRPVTTGASFTPAPAVVSVTPSRGGAAVTTPVTVRGVGLDRVTQVGFGPTSLPCPGPTCQVVDATRLDVTAPSREVGVVEVSVVSASGSSSRLAPLPETLFTYLGEPGVVDDLRAEGVLTRSLRLVWSAVGDGAGGLATRYVVKRSRSPMTDDASFGAATSLCASACSFDEAVSLRLEVDGLVPETGYWFAVKAVGDDGSLGALSNVVAARTADVVPGVVTDLVASARSGTRVRLGWSSVAGDGDGGGAAAVGYVVARSSTPIDSDGAFGAAAKLCDGVCDVSGPVGSALSVLEAGLTPQTRYFYALRAVDGAGNVGPRSSSVAVTTPVAVPGGVSDLIAAGSGRGEVRVSWSAVAEDGSHGGAVQRYEVRRSTSPLSAGNFDGAELLCTCAFGPDGPGDGLNVSLTALPASTRYWFGVRPVNRWGTAGPVSNIASVVTDGSIPRDGGRVEDAAVRVAGQDRIGTALALAREGWPGGASTVVLARADGFADALAAGPLAVAADAPLLLTFPDALDAAVSAEIDAFGTDTVYVIGGPQALSPAVGQALAEAGVTVRRLQGATRVETAAVVAREAAARWGGVDGAIVVRGDDFPDGLAATNLAAATKVPVVVSWPDELPGATSSVLDALLDQGDRVWIVGGTAALSSTVADQLDERYRVTRLAGADRYATAAALADAALEQGAPSRLVFIASGHAFPDALTSAPAAARLDGLLLLTHPTSLTGTTAAWLTGHRDSVVVAVVTGGPAALHPDLEVQLRKALR